MAANPLFNSIPTRKSVKDDSAKSQNSSQHSHFTTPRQTHLKESNIKDRALGGDRRMAGNDKSGNSPPDKRRRMEAETEALADDQLWGEDDDDFLTYDQLENIDTLISQSQQIKTKYQTPRNMHTVTDPHTTSVSRVLGRGTGRSLSTGSLSPRESSSNSNQQSTTGHKLAAYTRPGQQPHTSKSVYQGKRLSSLKPVAGIPSFSQSGNKAVCAAQPHKPSYGIHGHGGLAGRSQLTPRAGVTGSGQASPALPSGSHSKTDGDKQLAKRYREERDHYQQEVS